MNNSSARRAKTLSFATGVLFLLCLIGMMILSRSPPEPLATIAFVGFTNSSSRAQAVFALTNPPTVALGLHSVRTIDRSESAVSTQEVGHFSWSTKTSWGLLYAVTVDTTNEPLRFIFKFQRRATGPRRITEQIHELVSKLTDPPREFYTGTVYFITNETAIESLRP